MPERQFVGGYVKDLKDERDFPATRLVVREVPLPTSYEVNEATIIYDQGMHPACVGYSGAGIKTDEEFLERGKQIRFDGLRLYQECKKRDGIPNIEGTYPRVACKVLKDIGCWVVPPASSCPFRFLKPKPPEPIPDDVYKYHIEGYYRLEPKSPLELVLQTIFQYGSIMTASSWYGPWSGKFIKFPEPIGPSIGGHAYKGEGWTTEMASHKSLSFAGRATASLTFDDADIVIVNSYGTVFWGRNGKALMPWEMFLNHVLDEGDCWKLVDSISETG